MNCLTQILQQAKLADTHCHLHAAEFSGKWRQTLRRAQNQGVQEIWLVATDYHSAITNIEIIKEYDSEFPQLSLRLGIGFDPEIFVPGSELFNMRDFGLEAEAVQKKFGQLLEDLEGQAVSAGLQVDLIGEIGMDHYWLNENYRFSQDDAQAAKDEGRYVTRNDMERSAILQTELFRIQLEFAKQRQLPVSIHSRGAERECFELVKSVYQLKGPEDLQLKRRYDSRYHRFSQIRQELEAPPIVFHSFTGAVGLMRELYNHGLAIGVNGIATYKSGNKLREGIQRLINTVEANIPTSELAELKQQRNWKAKLLYESGFVLETDAPYLIPSTVNREQLKRHYNTSSSFNDPGAVSNILDFLIS